MNNYSWLQIWAPAGVLLLQILRLPIVSTLSLSTALHQGHTFSLKSQTLLGNRPFLFHYNPWQMLGWPRVYDKALKLERLADIRSELFNKESGLASRVSRKRQKEGKVMSSWLPAAQVRSGLQNALIPDVIDSVVSFDAKTRFSPKAERNGQKVASQKMERINKEHGNHEKHPKANSFRMHKLHVHGNLQTQDSKLIHASQKGNPSLRNSALPRPNAFRGFGGFQSFDVVPVLHKEPGLGGLMDVAGPSYFSESADNKPDPDQGVWMTAGSGQLKDSFGTIQSFEGHFVDEARDCDVIDKKICYGDDDCVCYGLYQCSTNRCVPTPVSSSDSSNRLGEFWHEQPMEIIEKRKSSKSMKIK